MLESLEGKRGMVRFKPPLPAIEGLFGQPTVVNNVISLASVPVIFSKGADYYKDFGQGRFLGTLTIQLAGNVRHGGLIELAFGVTLRELLEKFGEGTSTGKPARAVQYTVTAVEAIKVSEPSAWQSRYRQFHTQQVELMDGGRQIN